MSVSIRHIDQILDENKPIWVKNVHKPRGTVILSLIDRSGRLEKLEIPSIKHPICLTDRITADTIRNSRDLRDLISRKVLVLVTPAEAESYYELNPSAAEDVERAYTNMGIHNPEIRKMRETGKAESDALLYATHTQGDALVVGEFAAGPNALKILPTEIETAESEEDGDVQSKVKVLIAALASREKNARFVRADLDALDLTDADLTYIIANSTGSVQKYAKLEFAKRRGQSLDDAAFSDED